LFHEKFILDTKDDDPAGEYIEEDAEIKYYLPHIYNHESLEDTISHEWLHALFQWADEENWDAEKDHYAMRLLGFN
jgi:hypothetical protein